MNIGCLIIYYPRHTWRDYITALPHLVLIARTAPTEFGRSVVISFPLSPTMVTSSVTARSRTELRDIVTIRCVRPCLSFRVYPLQWHATGCTCILLGNQYFQIECSLIKLSVGSACNRLTIFQLPVSNFSPIRAGPVGDFPLTRWLNKAIKYLCRFIHRVFLWTQHKLPHFYPQKIPQYYRTDGT